MSQELRSWLMKHPRPASLRLSTNGESRILAVPAKVVWAELASSVAALAPELIEALDNSGTILRLVQPSAAIDDSEFEPEPARTAPISRDPAVANMHAIAEIIAGAYRHSTEIAFNRMVDLFEAVNRRSESLERSLDLTHNMLRKAYEAQAEAVLEAATNDAAAPAGGDPMAQMMQSFIGGAMANKPRPPVSAVPPTNGTTNGQKS